MLLTPSQVEQALEEVRSAFPAFSEWEHVNEEDEDEFGFSVWGAHEFDPEEYPSRRFFVTLETYRERWRGHLTIGQHAYMWTSADFGDAYLASTEECGSLSEAIRALKHEIATVCDVLTAGA